ncbi:MAG: general stress protein CsbD [Rhodocyclales bacterium GWA2_65_20]|nr:MAG: general stress protein CsbD [Rhodocyclales bacterium GWA2_65_20]
MNQNQLAGKWKQFKGKVKEQWGLLTDDLSLAVAGEREQLVGRIQEERGLSELRAQRQLNEFLYRNRNWKHF